MQTVLFYEAINPIQMTVVSFEDGRLLWREHIEKNSLAIWLKDAQNNGRIRKESTMFAILPEPEVGRQMIHVPVQSRPHERRAMAENALMIILGERPALLKMIALESNLAGQETWAISGAGKSVVQKWQAALGACFGCVHWISAVECALAFQDVLPVDGMYSLEAPFWTSVFVLQNGMVLHGVAGEGRALKTLQMTLLEEMKMPEYASLCTALYWQEGVECRENVLLERCFKKTCHAYGKFVQVNRPFLALLFLCVILPGMIWLGLQARPLPVDESGGEMVSSDSVTVKSSYSTLIEEAYQAKGARITILNQEASEGSLAIHGRCSEMLDLADYMNSLADSKVALHPLLLDATKKTDKERYFYEFVVEISLEGRKMP